MQQHNNTRPMDSKHTPPAPIPCILAIGEPTGETLTYRYRVIGRFDSKAAAKRRLAALQANQPQTLYLILDGRPEKSATVWDTFAAELQPPKSTRKGISAMMAAIERAQS